MNIKPVQPKIFRIVGMTILLLLPVSGSGAELGTRQQTIRPLALLTNTLQISPSNVPLYSVYGYSAWQLGPGEDEGRRFDLMPFGYVRFHRQIQHSARLLSLFSMSDIHITDKESPAELLYTGWSAPFGAGGLYISAYSPIVLSTTHVLDAAVKTINAVHRQTPFDFGISLGDDANCSQYNELRWFIDVMDGQPITPSSGAHLGSTNIDYQMPYQAAGLNRSIPWYQAIGNHDQFWMGTYYPDNKLRNALVDTNVLNVPTNFLALSMDGTGQYVGVVDGTTPYGVVIKGGPTNLFATPPTIVADTNRHTLTMATSSNTISCTNFMSEFFNTASSPAGHGFTQSNIQSNSACYSFEPLTNMPIKVIVLDDTCKLIITNSGPISGFGWIDTARYTWLTNELQMGQNSDQLMILACHIPIQPQANLFDTNIADQQFWVTSTNQALYPGFYTEAQMIATLHNYPNLILLMAGHRHLNTVTPQPSPDSLHPEYGFWEVETPSLRDFPHQFRTWEILRNSDNTISILTTDVDPVVEPGSPADKSRGYAIGIARISGGTNTWADTTSHAYNAELVKPLSRHMQTVIAGYGGPLGHFVSIDSDGSGVVINFLGELLSADTVLGPWTNVTNTSPYTESAAGDAKFYRAAE
jgi:metallophosphoesterase (TIGR03768 family)